MKDNDMPEVIYAYKTNDPKYKYYSNDPNAWGGDNIKYILADTSISKQMSVTLINQARKEEQDKHKARFQELEKDLLMNIKGTDGRQIIREAFKEVV